MKYLLVTIAWIMTISVAAASCVHPKVKFQKSMLLDPLMDPGKDGAFQQAVIADPARRIEHGSSSGAGSGGATCPTCGG